MGFFGACDGGGTGSGQLVKQKGLKGKVHVVSFDTSPEELQLFKDGYIDALIVQDPFQMGYRGVYAMDKVLKGEKVEPRVVEIPGAGRHQGQLRRPEDPGAAEPVRRVDAAPCRDPRSTRTIGGVGWASAGTAPHR